VENIRSNLIKANIYHLLGSVYDSLKREVEAETVYLKAEELYQSVGEENVLIYNDIGSFYANNGDLDLAKEYFGKSLEINANNYQVVNNMGNVFYNKGNIEKALHFFERSLILNPNQPGLREVVEKLKKELGQKQKTE
jgi:tetratricopeptide (TPR) repeat protein